jgi:hypothetical protein
VGLERSPVSLVSTNEELLGRKCGGFDLEKRDYGHGRSSALTTRHPLSANTLTLTSPTSSGLSVSIVHAKATDFFFLGDEFIVKFQYRTEYIFIFNRMSVCRPRLGNPDSNCDQEPTAAAESLRGERTSICLGDSVQQRDLVKA